MTGSAPKIDARTASDVSAQLVRFLRLYTKSPDPPANRYPFAPWNEVDPVSGQATGASAALVGIFARLAELVIQRLNLAPDKNFRAFLDLLGAARLPPEPARVPLAFSLVAGRTDDVVVPAGTAVAAQPTTADKGPIVFQTEGPIVVTATRLVSLVALDPESDTIADVSDRNVETAPPFQAFGGDHAVTRALYLGDERLFGYPRIVDLRVNITLASDLVSPDARQVIWERQDGPSWAPLVPVSDATQNLTRSGTVDLGAVAGSVADEGAVAPSTVGGRSSRWLRARLATALTVGPTVDDAHPPAGMVRATADQLPLIKRAELSVDVKRDAVVDGIVPEVGLTDGAPIDLTKEFFPFGEKPKLFTAFFLASRDAFAKDPTSVGAAAGARVDLAIAMSSSLAVVASDDLELVWECSSATGWREVGRSGSPTNPSNPTSPPGFSDGTLGFRKTGTVTLQLPDDGATATVNGQENHWLRVRLVKGNYGKPAQYVLVPGDPTHNVPDSFRFVPETFTPPVISKIKVGYRFTATRPVPLCLTENYFAFDDVTLAASGSAPPFAPFTQGPDQSRPGLSLGFELPSGKTSFPNATLNLYASLAPVKYGERAVPLSPDVSSLATAPDSTVVHEFFVVMTAKASQSVEVEIAGYGWASALALGDGPTNGAHLEFDVVAGEERIVTVQVTVPSTAPPGASDRGFLRLRSTAAPDVLYEARFVTTAGVTPALLSPLLVWQYWNGSSWIKLAVRDDSQNFTRPGLVEFVAPRDMTARKLFGKEQFWLRVLWDRGDFGALPRLRQIMLNTGTAIQGSTVSNEILGSSTGAKSQVFRATRTPVQKGQQVQVREPELPLADERELLEAEEGSDAISVVTDTAGRPKEIWVRWHEVADFYGSGARDRHYVIDHLTGEIHFGDGVSGRIPPLGPGNIRLARYQTGGGASGNRPAGTVNQLKTTVPYIDKVINPEAASGGAEVEPLDALLERVPRSLRHRDRAVTIEDYEDLAVLASAEVARSFCVPLRDLGPSPLGNEPIPGVVSIVVVPRTSDTKPRPTLELISRVKDFVEQRTPAGASLVVVGPVYVRVDVHAEIAVASAEDASAIDRAVRERLASFLHPLTGGLDRGGWDFGREPHRSDLVALIEDVDGVDHVRFLEVREIEDVEHIRVTGRFLVSSGEHEIDLFFDET